MIVVDHVTKYYGAHAAARDLSFSIDEGECVGFLGLNGAGKTTTLRMLSCLLLPTSGRIRIRGLDAEDAPHEIRKFIGFLPDTPPVYGEMTVAEFLRFAGQLRRMTRGDVDRRLPAVLETTSLTNVADQPIATLSHGYRQRVGIAQAIIHEPALLILDEPIQGLDPVQIVEMRELIRRLRGKHTILLSTHILSEIEQTCDRILMLSKGRIAAQGSEADLAARFGGGKVLELDVTLGAVSLDALVATLGALDGVRKVEATGGADGERTLRVEADRDVRADAARATIDAGVGLVGLRHVQTGLESIFVELTRGAEGARSVAPPVGAS